jgi:RimJ/RimL family protein N-acetyltransferase
VREDDAALVLDYLNVVSGETDFLTFAPGEFGMTTDEEAAHIRRLYADSTGFMLKAVVDNEIVSLAGVQSTQRPRTRHVGLFGISVLKRFWGTGIGPAICRQVLVEAKAMGLRRVELKVREDNVRAVKLYKNCGFREEGRLRGSFVVADRSYDELVMGLLL